MALANVLLCLHLAPLVSRINNGSPDYIQYHFLAVAQPNLLCWLELRQSQCHPNYAITGLRAPFIHCCSHLLSSYRSSPAKSDGQLCPQNEKWQPNRIQRNHELCRHGWRWIRQCCGHEVIWTTKRHHYIWRVWKRGRKQHKSCLERSFKHCLQQNVPCFSDCVSSWTRYWNDEQWRVHATEYAIAFFSRIGSARSPSSCRPSSKHRYVLSAGTHQSQSGWTNLSWPCSA